MLTVNYIKMKSRLCCNLNVIYLTARMTDNNMSTGIKTKQRFSVKSLTEGLSPRTLY